MDTLYNRNGLIFWTEREINIRQMLVNFFVGEMKTVLRNENRAFEFMQVEAPILTPFEFVNKNYTNDDYFSFDDKGHCPTAVAGSKTILRPETTMGSYCYAKWLFEHTETKIRKPLCVWQHGKSFRREQDQVTKNMRLKEFYQLEFQCIYGLTTANDYSKAVIPVVQQMLTEMVGPCYTEASDRLPDYSSETVDVIFTANNMELCSISKRTDFPDAHVLEVAIGTDRCVYNFTQENP